MNVDFCVSDIDNFQITVFYVHSSTQTTRSVRIVTVGSSITTPFVNKMSFTLSFSVHGERGCGPRFFFNMIIRENSS